MSMRHLRAAFAALALLACAAPAHAFLPCDRLWSWLEYQCSGIEDAWTDGTPDLYITGYSHHDRHTYTKEKIEGFNERAWGLGYGWSKRNDRGDDFGVYGLAFRDSHFKWTKMVGWKWMTYWPDTADYAVGLGYTAFLGSRPDIYHGVPFPGLLPLAGAKLGKAEILGTYIPKVSQNTTGNGNVGFVFMRYHF